MSRLRGGLPAALASAAAAAGTTWVATFSWRGFTDGSSLYLGPLLVLAVVVAVTGAVARWARVAAPLVVLLQVALAGMLASLMLSGSPIPVGGAWTELQQTFTDASNVAQRYAPPVPEHADGGVYAFFIAGGLACLLLVDVLACTLRRVPLAGLPLLAIYSVPVSMLEDGVSWWVFALTAGGFMLMLFLQVNDQLVRWGRPLGSDEAVRSRRVLGAHRCRPGDGRHHRRGHHRARGDPPDLHPDPRSGAAAGWQRTRRRRHPHREPDDRPAPRPAARRRHPAAADSHLRPGPGLPADLGAQPVLGERVELRATATYRPTSSRTARCRRWSGVADSVPRTEYRYDVTIGDDFESIWLPTQSPVSADRRRPVTGATTSRRWTSSPGTRT